MEQGLYVKVGQEYHKMVKQEIDESSKVFDAFYVDKTGELLWVERKEVGYAINQKRREDKKGND